MNFVLYLYPTYIHTCMHTYIHTYIQGRRHRGWRTDWSPFRIHDGMLLSNFLYDCVVLDSYWQAFRKINKRKGKGLIGTDQFPMEVQNQMVNENCHFKFCQFRSCTESRSSPKWHEVITTRRRRRRRTRTSRRSTSIVVLLSSPLIT